MKEKPTPHYKHPIYADNKGNCSLQGFLPLPPGDGMPLQIKTYEDVNEPKFNPDIHLSLGYPKNVKVFPDFEVMDKTPPIGQNDESSRFAYSAPFQVFSAEGIRVLKAIIKREEHNAVCPKYSRGNKFALRGLYYLSPFVRDLQQCHLLREHFRTIAGEELIPHPSYSNSPQVNLSVPGSRGPVDHWHYDSIAYTGVVLLNDVEDMDGGKLEIMQHDKHEALDKLAKNQPYKSEVVGYEKAGKMILAQGSEILHHVTPVTSSSTRISLIFGYGPSNSFQPPKTILKTMKRVDVVHNLADYEFFREKAWQTMHCLKHFVDTTKYEPEGYSFGTKLRTVGQELMRAADILQGNVDDTINVFNELHGKIVSDYKQLGLSK